MSNLVLNIDRYNSNIYVYFVIYCLLLIKIKFYSFLFKKNNELMEKKFFNVGIIFNFIFSDI